jgi:glutamyl-tRNA synthetase
VSTTVAPRVRFAPSPTGYFHVGSARTSLFNWLFARQSGGTFVLRIEDTDAERGRPEWRDGILSAMSWLGLSADEGPFHQSEAEQRHRALADALFDGGFLYACDCTRTEIDERTKANPTPGYDGHCRQRGVERSPETALRFRVPDDGETVVDDIIRGRVTFPHASMEDFVAVKSSGHPLFALANVIDDRDMKITHIIRGEDLLPTTPKQLLLWSALDEVDRPVELARFAHLPMLVNEQRKKLSKRRDPVAVESYRDAGYLPDAFVNYLALLGWSPKGEVEIVDRATLVEQFRLDEVHHAPAFFDVAKMTHINGEYIRALSPESFVEATLPWVDPSSAPWQPEDRLPPWPKERFDPALFVAVAPLIQERVATLGEVPSMVDFLFLAEPPLDETAVAKVILGDERARSILDAAIGSYRTVAFTPEDLHAATLAVADELGVKLRIAQAPVRVAVTGRSVGPPLFESLALLGRDEVVRRLEGARALIQA